MSFPYEHYKSISQQFRVYYLPDEEVLVRWIIPTLENAIQQLSKLLKQPKIVLEVLIVPPTDWHLVPHDDDDQLKAPHPYWTSVTTPPTLVVPTEIDAIFGEMTAPKFAFILYHEVALAFTEADSRPWPEDYPLWADEWTLKFAALWLSYTLDRQEGLVNQDIAHTFEDAFEPEPDGKTAVTIRGFDWYEDTSQDDYLRYQILLEQFASDLLSCYMPEILPSFLNLYRVEKVTLLSDEVTAMLAEVLGPGGSIWLEDLIYF